MAEPKTKPTDASVEEFLDSVDNERRRDEGKRVDQIMREETGTDPRMWGPTMVGYGSYRYVSPKDPKRSGDWPPVAFSPRKTALTLYGLKDNPAAAEHLARLGAYTEGAGCIYVKRLDQIDEQTLRTLIRIAYERTATEE